MESGCGNRKLVLGYSIKGTAGSAYVCVGINRVAKAVPILNNLFALTGFHLVCFLCLGAVEFPVLFFRDSISRLDRRLTGGEISGLGSGKGGS